MAPTRDQLVDLTKDPTRFLGSGDAVLRRMAVTALSPEQARANLETLTALATDDDVSVRAAAVEKLGVCGPGALPALEFAIGDAEPTVREAAATAYGEVRSSAALDRLIAAATGDGDRHVREAAVAALGAVGDDRAVDTLLVLLIDGPPQVRRRAIAALTVFDDDRIEPAIRRAAFDRNPSVREAAEMVVGKQLRGTG